MTSEQLGLLSLIVSMIIGPALMALLHVRNQRALSKINKDNQSVQNVALAVKADVDEKMTTTRMVEQLIRQLGERDARDAKEREEERKLQREYLDAMKAGTDATKENTKTSQEGLEATKRNNVALSDFDARLGTYIVSTHAAIEKAAEQTSAMNESVRQTNERLIEAQKAITEVPDKVAQTLAPLVSQLNTIGTEIGEMVKKFTFIESKIVEAINNSMNKSAE
jgi:hypothetical protein